MMETTDRTAAPAAPEGAGPSSGRRTCPTCGSTDIVPGGYATSLGALDACRRCDAALWPEQRQTDPAPAAPAPDVEAMRRDLGPAKYEAGRALKDAFLDAPTWEDFAERAAAILARLGAEPAADPARATLAGAVREAAQAAHDVLCKVLSHSVDRHEGMTLMRDARDGIRAALAAEPDAGDGVAALATKPAMTATELQAEIGRLQMQLFYRVAGNPMQGVSLPIGGFATETPAPRTGREA